MTTVVVVFAAPTPASAAEDWYYLCGVYPCQTGVEVGAAEGVCMTGPASTRVCVKYDGDYVYVLDGKADGNAAMGIIDSEKGIGRRYCRNPHGNGTWARCNFDWSESGKKSVFGGVKYDHISMYYEFLWSFSNN
ncbi:hypothetical protein [Micromonospora zhanjiangensis]